MSLVNLAHACSHLQNASLARLGLTSIPYTKLHLSIALLLQKQGFLSQVKLGGKSPPASCFGNGPSDNNDISSHLLKPHERDPRGPEMALSYKVRTRATRAELEARGFGPEAVEFAEEHSIKNYDELIRDGVLEKALGFVASVRKEIDVRVIRELRRLEDAGELEKEGTPDRSAIRDQETTSVLSSLSAAEQLLFNETVHLSAADLPDHLSSHSTLLAYAGSAAYKSLNYIRNNGITMSTMSLAFPNQQITLPNPDFADPDGLDAEGVVTQANRASRRLWLGLKYHSSMPVLSKAKMISKPTKRIWLDCAGLGKVIRGGSAGEVKGMRQIGEIMAVSTDRGIMEARECVERRIGGQPLIRVW